MWVVSAPRKEGGATKQAQALLPTHQAGQNLRSLLVWRWPMWPPNWPPSCTSPRPAIIARRPAAASLPHPPPPPPAPICSFPPPCTCLPVPSAGLATTCLPPPPPTPRGPWFPDWLQLPRPPCCPGPNPQPKRPVGLPQALPRTLYPQPALTSPPAPCPHRPLTLCTCGEPRLSTLRPVSPPHQPLSSPPPHTHPAAAAACLTRRPCTPLWGTAGQGRCREPHQGLV